jgi:hypothetical protein
MVNSIVYFQKSLPPLLIIMTQSQNGEGDTGGEVEKKEKMQNGI